MFARSVCLVAITLSVAAATIKVRAEERTIGPPDEQAFNMHACQDCISHRCVLVPETKQIKKIVYEVQEVPYCVKKLPPLFSFHKRGCDCDQCTECDCVRYKKVLVKKEIVCGEICTTKCVPEPCIAK